MGRGVGRLLIILMICRMECSLGIGMVVVAVLTAGLSMLN